MKKALCFAAVVCVCALSLVYAQTPQDTAIKIVLLVTEQNIDGPQRAWWASEVDLSVLEATVATKLLAEGIEVLEPSALEKVIQKNPAFRKVSIGPGASVKMGKFAQAQYVVVGKALASAGGNVPSSTMRSCYANVTVKLIRVKDGKVVAYLNASGSSAHPDVITGGKEALASAGEDLAGKLITALKK